MPAPRAAADDAEPAPAVPDDAEPAPAVPDDAEPAPAVPDDAEPAPAVPDDAEPAPAVPDDAEPAPAVPDDAEPAPAVPDDAEPAPAVPDDAEPAPAVPDDAEPAPAGSRDGVGEAGPSAPDVAPVPTPSAGSATADDFRRIQGIGPKMAAALQGAGIRTYRQLADLDEAGLRDTIRTAGLRGAPSLATWPQQAKVLAGAPAEADQALPAPVGADDLS
ncbi:hypothetical protein [Micromonospora rubida]|uniref:hypothetical protein n=1 Tax=Micromonospora rubida TaxID=2697657 RepID=UPI0038B3CE1E